MSLIPKMKTTIYTKNGCAPCAATKAWLDENRIEYKQCNVQEPDNLTVVQELGFRTVPVVLIEGHEPFSGFRPDLLEGLLK